MVYTVKQLADLASVSVRTLHYYDEIGLLKPARVGENGYRYYEGDEVLRLQQILFYRELGFSLGEINEILDAPDFELLTALQSHRRALAARRRRLRGLIETIDNTIQHLNGEIEMSDKQLFRRFTEEEEKRYAQEAREAWGSDEVDASYKRWNSYSAEKKEQIMAEGNAIYTGLVAAMEHGPASPEVQEIIARWHEHMRYFYEPSVERLRGLGDLYVNHPDFAKNFRSLHAELPEFMREAIGVYCDELEE